MSAHEVFSEGNMGNITETMLIDIFLKLGIVENIHIAVTSSLDEVKIYSSLFQEFRDVFVWSYEEMPVIDSSIVMQEIPTYPNAKSVR